MNEIRRIVSASEEIATIRAILEQEHVPAFVTGYDVRLGEFDGEPAMWITVHTTGLYGGEAWLSDAKKVAAVHHQLHEALQEHHPQRYPYFRAG